MQETMEISEEELWDEFILEEKRIAVIKNDANEFTFGEIKDDVLIDLSGEDFAKAEEKYKELIEIFEEK